MTNRCYWHEFFLFNKEKQAPYLYHRSGVAGVLCALSPSISSASYAGIICMSVTRHLMPHMVSFFAV